MQRPRALPRHHRALVLLLAAALAVKALIPAGFMPALASSGAVTISLCGAGDARLVLALPQGEHPAPAPSESAAKAGACAFVALWQAAIAGSDGPLLLATPAPVLLLAAAPAARLLLGPRAFLRPPLRGPPLPR